MTKAAFSLVGYKFDKVFLDLSSLTPESEFEISFSPTGEFDSEKGTFKLIFDFSANTSTNKSNVISVRCVALFRFEEVKAFSDIPEYFYANSIAILFPYVRAFISTVTLQANIRPIVLPTYNVSSLKEKLINNTSISNGNRD